MKSSIKNLMVLIVILPVLITCRKDSSPSQSETTKTLSLGVAYSWKIASIPLRFPESILSNDLAIGFNRAKFSWYAIDPSVFWDKGTNLRPVNLTRTDMSGDDCRLLYLGEVFPEINTANNAAYNLQTLNLDFYPSERGPWNYDTSPTASSAGLNSDGSLLDPASRWGGMMRKLDPTDFSLNYLDFWLLDPFSTYPDADGKMYINLGDISEDVLKDGLLSAENTVPGTLNQTAWGNVLPISNLESFTSHETDKGLNELNDGEETDYFTDYLSKINQYCSPGYFAKVSADPSADNFHSYMGDDYDALNYKVRERYKNYTGDDQNSSSANTVYGISSRNPDREDINRNNLLDTLNNYFEYEIDIHKESFLYGMNYIVDYRNSNNDIVLEDGHHAKSTFYHFRIPLSDFTTQVGTPTNTGHPQFMRIYLTGFSGPVNLRFINMLLSESIQDAIP